ncbi:MAG: PilZ domain-containing protein [Planctomycetes bacterium]|nr:PilZ domain-containing protein [Planctomycetota bacterium]
MLNVLVLDPAQCSSFLIRSILLGAGHAVSVSPDGRDASRKMATGLFDVALVDFAGEPAACAEFVHGTNVLLPELPVIALYREDEPPKLDGLQIYLTVNKPVRVTRVTEALRRAATYLNAPRAFIPGRCAVQFPVEVLWGLDALPCRVSSISDRGMLLEAADRDFAHLRSFDHFFDTLSGESIDAKVRLGDDEQIPVGGKVAFLERTPDSRVRRVGVVFTEVQSTDVNLLRSYISLVGGPV